MKKNEIPVLKISRQFDIVDIGFVIKQNKRGCWGTFIFYLKRILGFKG